MMIKVKGHHTVYSILKTSTETANITKSMTLYKRVMGSPAETDSLQGFHFFEQH